jgi:hypothetical protein
MVSEDIIKTAHHEAGHIIFTYSFFYYCDSVEIMPSGDGMTRMNYGEDLFPIAAMTHFVTDNSLFAGLPLASKRRCAALAVPLSLILLGGPIAQAMYEKNMIGDAHMEVEVSGKDLERVTEIDAFLTTFYPGNHSKTFIQDILSHTMSLAKNIPEYRAAIEKVAEKIIATPNHRLFRHEIEAVLNECGFIEYCKNSLGDDE